MRIEIRIETCGDVHIAHSTNLYLYKPTFARAVAASAAQTARATPRAPGMRPPPAPVPRATWRALLHVLSTIDIVTTTIITGGFRQF